MSNPYSAPIANFANGSETYEPKLFATTGRIGRIRYLAYYNILVLLAYAAGAVAFVIGMSVGTPAAIFAGIVIFIPTCYLVLMFGKRRLHDLDKSGWWMLLVVIPLVGFIFSLYMMFAPGSKEPNRFGPAPAPNTTALVLAGTILPIIMFVGILAAIALPAYQAYVQRAQEAHAASSVEAVEDSGE